MPERAKSPVTGVDHSAYSHLLTNSLISYIMVSKGRIFSALADPIRREILAELGQGDLAAGEIVDLFEVSAPAISRHLSILSAADLVTKRREGGRVIYSANPEPLAESLSEFLNTACPVQTLQRLGILPKKPRKRRRAKSTH